MVDFIPHLCQILIYEACSSSTKIFQLYVTPNVFDMLTIVGPVTIKMYFTYKIQITLLKSNSNTSQSYWGYEGQNTKCVSGNYKLLSTSKLLRTNLPKNKLTWNKQNAAK